MLRAEEIVEDQIDQILRWLPLDASLRMTIDPQVVARVQVEAIGGEGAVMARAAGTQMVLALELLAERVRLAELVPTVVCTRCQETVPRREAHLNQQRWIGYCCGDEVEGGS